MQDNSQTREEEVTRTGMEIAIIGMSARFPGAKTIDQFWDNLKNSVESVAFFSDEDLEAAGIPAEDINNPNYIYVRARGILEDIEKGKLYFCGGGPDVRVGHGFQFPSFIET